MTSTAWGAYARPGSGFPTITAPSEQDRARSAALQVREERRRERTAVAAEIRARQAVSRARERVTRLRLAVGEPGADMGVGLRRLAQAREDLRQAERELSRVTT